MGYGFQGKAVTIVAGEKIAVALLAFIDLVDNRTGKIFIVYKYHVMGGSIHTLQKAITAVIDTVQHMGEIKITLAANAVTRRCIKHEVFEFFCKYQGGPRFLHPEVLIFSVKDFAIILTSD